MTGLSVTGHRGAVKTEKKEIKTIERKTRKNLQRKKRKQMGRKEEELLSKGQGHPRSLHRHGDQEVPSEEGRELFLDMLFKYPSIICACKWSF